MSLIVLPPVTNYELAPEGSFAARLYSLIDLGTQETAFGVKHQLFLSWEIDERTEDGKPFTVSRRFTWSLHEKSGLRSPVEALLGRKLADDELKFGFDIAQLLGATCLVTIEHSMKGDRNYANVKSVSPLPKGMNCQPAVNAKKFLWLTGDGWNITVFDGLTEWMRQTIEKSPEYHALWAPKPKAKPVPSKPIAAQKPTIADDLNDAIPF
jgi:hypothetical protein